MSLVDGVQPWAVGFVVKKQIAPQREHLVLPQANACMQEIERFFEF